MRRSQFQELPEALPGGRCSHLCSRSQRSGVNARTGRSVPLGRGELAIDMQRILGARRGTCFPTTRSLVTLRALTQPRPSTEPAGASSGESRVVLHAHATQDHGRVSPEVALPAVSLVGCRSPSYQIVGCVLPILLPAVL